MSHAKRLALLVAAGAAMGCCPVRWPASQRLAPAKAYVRYVALAVKAGDERCYEEAKGNEEEMKGCAEVYSVLKRELLKLEDE